jgi:hypothetical protein
MEFLKNEKIEHILLGNGFCKQISSKFNWTTIIENCEQIRHLQNKYEEENLEKLLAHCDEKERNIIINNFFYYFKKNHPNYLTEGNKMINWECINNTLKVLTSIFTLNYDLLLYWLFVKDAKERRAFKDGFCQGDNLRFLESSLGDDSCSNVYYLHGAAFIYQMHNSEYKLRYGNSLERLVTQFQNKKLVPVYVFESGANKMNQIKKFDYLKYCHRQLGKIHGSICIYGTSLHENDPIDKHIIEKLLTNEKIDKIYLGIYQDKVQLPKYLHEHDNKIIPFSTKEFKFNDNCKPGPKAPDTTSHLGPMFPIIEDG